MKLIFFVLLLLSGSSALAQSAVLDGSPVKSFILSAKEDAPDAEGPIVNFKYDAPAKIIEVWQAGEYESFPEQVLSAEQDSCGILRTLKTSDAVYTVRCFNGKTIVRISAPSYLASDRIFWTTK